MAKSVVIVLFALILIAGGVAVLLRDDTDKMSSGSMSSMDDSEMNMQSEANSSNTQKPVEVSNPEATDKVSIKDYAYAPAAITIKKGTTVTWTNEDSVRHDITPDTVTSDFKTSDLLSKGNTYTVTFNSAGTFTYYCSPHPYMKGTVIVTD